MRRLVLAVVVAGLTGCSGEVTSPLGERAIVKGKVTLGGKAVTKGLVVFTPTDPSKGDEQTGQIQPNGDYITSVFPGTYRITIVDSPRMPDRYKKFDQTRLEFDIPSAGKPDANLDLQ